MTRNKSSFLDNRMLLVVYFLTCIVVIACQDAARIELNPTTFEFKLKEFVDFALKHTEFQSHFWSVYNTNKERRTRRLNIRQVADTIDREFSNVHSALRALVNSLSISFESGQNRHKYPACCEDVGIHYDRRFSKKVLLSDACVLFIKAVSNKTSLGYARFADEARKNLASMSHIRWQYFASLETGQFTTYPGNCIENYDFRTRPWYFSHISSRAKNAVIIIDTSKSMSAETSKRSGTTRLELAKRIALRIIASLKLNDRVAVIAFGNRPMTLRIAEESNGGCYITEFAYVTTWTRNVLTDYIKSLKAKGDSSVGLAVAHALKYFEKREQFPNEVRRLLFGNRTREDTIHLITDGEILNDLSKISEILVKHSFKMLHTLVYGVSSEGGEDIFRSIANNFTSTGRKAAGKLISLNDDLTGNVLDLFHQFAQQSPKNYIEKSPPYIDYFGLGRILTLSSPVYVKNKLIGVVGMDIRIQESFTTVANYRPNDVSYAFLMDDAGWVISHPMLPAGDVDVQVFLDSLEPSNLGFADVLSRALRKGSTRQREVNVSRLYSPGDSKYYGILRTARSVARYSVQKIVTMNYYLFVVTAGASYRYTVPGGFLSDSFYFHQLDLNPSLKACSHLNKFAVGDKTSVFIARRAFNDSSFNIREFTSSHVQRIKAILEGSTPNDNLINEDASRDIVATSILESLWRKAGTDELNNYIAWRYIGTESGIFRVFPATELNENYVPGDRAWYLTASAFRNETVMLPPRIHNESGAPIVAIAAAIFQKRQQSGNYTKKTPIFGVMGIEFLLTYIHSLFLSLYPDCKKEDTFKCIVIDHGGFVIISDDYVKGKSFDGVKHLADIEPQITSVLLAYNVLQRINCSNVVSGKLQRMYRIAEHQGVFWGTFGQGYFDFFGFKLIPVRNTNTFLIIRSVTQSSCVRDFFCTCPEKGEECFASWVDRHCECPCPSYDESLHHCDRYYEPETHFCPPSPPELHPIIHIFDLSGLPVCYNISIAQFSASGYNEVTLALISLSASVGVIVMMWAAYNSRRFVGTFEELLNYRKQAKQQRIVENLARDLYTHFIASKKTAAKTISLTKVSAAMRKHFKS